MLKRSALLTSTLLVLGSLTACGQGAAADDGEVQAVAAFYPLEFVTARVGGDAVAVQNLAKPGAEPHDLELTLDQAAAVGDADLVVYLKGFQPAVDEAVAGEAGAHAFDVARVEPLADATEQHEGEEQPAGGKDPHVWLDPARLATIADRVAVRLAAADTPHAADYTARARALRTDLETLDKEYAAGLQTCQRREIVTSHTAFGYLARRYNLEQVGITGLAPDAEPTVQRVTAVADQARAHGATTIFFETLVSPNVAHIIADTVGAKTAVLDPIEGLQPGATGDYLSVMRSNLSTLRTALGCS